MTEVDVPRRDRSRETERSQRNTPQAALALRLAGASYGEISEVLGLPSTASAYEAVTTALSWQDQGETETKQRLRAEESARLERLIRSVWSRAINPSDPEHLAAVKTTLSLVDRHIRLLGLDAPQEVVVYSPAEQEITEWVRYMMSTQADFGVTEPDIIEAEVAP